MIAVFPNLQTLWHQARKAKRRLSVKALRKQLEAVLALRSVVVFKVVGRLVLIQALQPITYPMQEFLLVTLDQQVSIARINNVSLYRTTKWSWYKEIKTLM
jgi:hypothetical protein